jgi:hypothetical protein
LTPKINYIKHLQAVHNRFLEDERLNPWHISLYYALFHNWNFNQFSNEFQIVRVIIMKEAKIGSANTYTKCLKELSEWGYIHYSPSYNPYKSSVVSIITFDTSTDKGSDKGCNKGTNKSSDKGGVTDVRPLIKHNKTNINYINNINSNSIELDNTQNEKNENFVFKKKKNVSKKVETNTPKNLEEVEAYFLQKEKPKSEANKFFNFYEANGWMVGKNKMKNWRAAANNWMANIGKYNNNNQKEKPNYLHVEQDKDYSIPL